MEEFEERIKEIDELYKKAVKKEDYREVAEKANELEEEMKKAGRSTEEIAEGILNGLWGEYYYIRNAETEAERENLPFLERKVLMYYQKVKDPALQVNYGYLLAVITSELEENFEEARRITKEIREIAEKTRNIALILKEVNTRGLQKMKEGDFKGAVEVFNEINDFKNIPRQAFHEAGNIINNRGASKIRGKISKPGGLKDLFSAGIYYLGEKQPPLKHIKGLGKRILEAFE